MYRAIWASITILVISGGACAEQSRAYELNDRAIAALAQGNRAEAEHLYRASIEEWDRLGAAFEAHRAVTELNLAEVLSVGGKRQEAFPIYQRAVAVFRRVVGDRNLHTVGALNMLGGAYLMSSDYKLGQPVFEEALRIARECFPADIEAARALGGLAAIHFRENDTDAALPLPKKVCGSRWSRPASTPWT